MKNYRCHCGNTIPFEDTLCLACDRSLGFLPDSLQMDAFALQADGLWEAGPVRATPADARQA